MFCLKWHAVINGFLITFVVLFTLEIKSQNSPYEYTIEVPKYKCDKQQNLEAKETVIRLLGKDAQKLKYDWSVNFKNTEDCKNKQRCTLMAWKAVRDLEKYLQTVGSSNENLQELKIDNSLLLPGLQYVLNVTVANNGTKVGSKEFILECTNDTIATVSTTTTTTTMPITTSDTVTTIAASTVNESAELTGQPKEASVKLLGANITYRDMMYILNAEATGCGDDNCHYYFKWEVLDNTRNEIITEPTKGSQLQLASDILTATQQYTIRCSLMSTEKTEMVAMASQSIQVLERGMVLRLSVSALSVGRSQPFKLYAYFNDADNLDGIAMIEWICTDNNKEKCAGFNSINATTIESKGLSAVGRYNVTITATKGNTIKKDWCEIEVVENGFAKIEVENADQPIDPSKAIEIATYVSMLITSCTLQWTSVRSANYEYLDLQTIPGNISAITNITTREDEFLNEIDEYSNNTVDMEYNLKIPSPKGDWKGLQEDTSYLFRLNVTCPIVQENSDDDDDDETAEPLLMKKYVTLTTDVPLHTYTLPSLNSLEVTPAQGIALKTLFYFQTNETVGDNSDFPILYKFGYFLNNQVIFVSNLMDVTTTRSVLPYIDKGVKTVLEGCNSYSLCAQIFGPTIATEVPLVSDKDQSILMSQLTELFERDEYYKAFTYSLAILQTFDSVDKSVLANMQGFVFNHTISDIKKLLTQSDDDNNNWRVPANDLIKNVGLLLNEFANSEDLLNNVVALRNKLANKKDFKLLVENIVPPHTQRKLLMVDEPKRVKRQSEKISIDEVKSYLIISELIITTSPDRNKVKQEKQNMLNQIDKFMQQLCNTLYERSQIMNLELKTLILSVEKINKNNYNRYLHILYDSNSWKVNGRIKLGKCFTEKMSDNRMCLGRVVLKNYLNKKGLVYMIKAYSADAHSESKQDTICDFVLVLPIDEKQIERKYVKCALWRKKWLQSQCKTLQVTAKTIQCTCNDLGYYSLEYNSLPPLQTTTTAVPELVVIVNPVETPTEASLLPTADVAAVEVTTLPSKLDNKTLLELLPVPSTTTKSILVPEESTKGSENVLEEDILFTVDDLDTNATDLSLYVSEEPEETVLYLIIGFSLVGIGVLLYAIKYVLYKREDSTSHNDSPKLERDCSQQLTPFSDSAVKHIRQKQRNKHRYVEDSEGDNVIENYPTNIAEKWDSTVY